MVNRANQNFTTIATNWGDVAIVGDVNSTPGY